jgi:hypothetical protein
MVVYAAYILSSAAIALSAFTFLAYVVFRHLQNVAKVSETRQTSFCSDEPYTPQVIIMHMSVMLTVTLLVMLGSMNTSGVRCAVGAALMHYCLLSMLCWMMAAGFHVNQLFANLLTQQVFPWTRARVICYLAPAAVAALSAGLRWDVYPRQDFCWVPLARATRWAFFAPLITVCSINTLLMLRAVHTIYTLHVRSGRRQDMQVPRVAAGGKKTKQKTKNKKNNK